MLKILLRYKEIFLLIIPLFLAGVLFFVDTNSKLNQLGCLQNYDMKLAQIQIQIQNIDQDILEQQNDLIAMLFDKSSKVVFPAMKASPEVKLNKKREEKVKKQNEMANLLNKQSSNCMNQWRIK